MANLLVRSLAIPAAIAACCASSAVASAQDAPISTSADVPTAINEIFFNRSGPYSRNRSIFSQSAFILGAPDFPESRVLSDVIAVREASLFLLNEQTTSDPTIRVPDLLNPFNTSVQFLPSSGSGGLSGSEFIFEPAFLP